MLGFTLDQHGHCPSILGKPSVYVPHALSCILLINIDKVTKHLSIWMVSLEIHKPSGIMRKLFSIQDKLYGFNYFSLFGGHLRSNMIIIYAMSSKVGTNAFGTIANAILCSSLTATMYVLLPHFRPFLSCIIYNLKTLTFIFVHWMCQNLRVHFSIWSK